LLYEGHGSYQQLNSSQTEASPVSIDIDLNSVPSEAQEDANDVLENEDKSQVIVDLRSEAKIAAQVSSSSMVCIPQIRAVCSLSCKCSCYHQIYCEAHIYSYLNVTLSSKETGTSHMLFIQNT
jgi:hypothetical protein